MTGLNTHNPCHCGSNLSFDHCCLPVIQQHSAQSAEQLMRSRYSAYVLQDESYLLDSWHSSTRPTELDLASEKTIWLKLKIIHVEEFEVHFIAFFSQQEKYFALVEKSAFCYENNHWYYLHGRDNDIINVSKNMSCPCGSGKKYKRCCAI